MGQVSLSHYVSHVCTRAWQRHGVELGEFGYRVLVRQVRTFGHDTLLRREGGGTVTHHWVRFAEVPMVVVYDHRQQRIRTVLPKRADLPWRPSDPDARVRETRELVELIRAQLAAVRHQLAAGGPR